MFYELNIFLEVFIGFVICIYILLDKSYIFYLVLDICKKPGISQAFLIKIDCAWPNIFSKQKVYSVVSALQSVILPLHYTSASMFVHAMFYNIPIEDNKYYYYIISSYIQLKYNVEYSSVNLPLFILFGVRHFKNQASSIAQIYIWALVLR